MGATDIREAIARRKNLLATADNILAKCKTEGRQILHTVEQKDLDNVMGKIDQIDLELNACGITNEFRTAVRADDGGPRPFNYGQVIGMAPEADEKGRVRMIQSGRSYRSMFKRGDTEPLGSDGFESFDQFLRAVHSGLHHPQLKPITETRVMGELIGSSGGFLVPEEYGAMLLDGSLEQEIVRPRAQVWPMTSATRKIPGFDGGDHTSGLFGGFTGTWLAENATATEVDAKFRLIELNAKKLACYTKASNELVADGMSFEQILGSALTSCVAWYLDYACLQGLGSGQPLGLLRDPALIVVGAETGQAKSSIVYENLTKMYARLHPACLNSSSCVWIANSTCVPELMKVSIVTGTAGAHYPVLKEDAGRFYIFGKQVLLTEKVPAVGLQGDLAIVDLSQYAVGLRKEVSLERSNAPGWLQDAASYRAIVRCDGMGTWGKAVTPKNGDSLSWAVTLAARP